VGFDFDVMASPKGEDLLQALRVHWCDVKEIVRDLVTPGQKPVLPAAIEAIQYSLFTGAEGKVPANDYSLR
jgi:hypothetical protein